jgi:hypothetical protein
MINIRMPELKDSPGIWFTAREEIEKYEKIILRKKRALDEIYNNFPTLLAERNRHKENSEFWKFCLDKAESTKTSDIIFCVFCSFILTAWCFLSIGSFLLTTFSSPLLPSIAFVLCIYGISTLMLHAKYGRYHAFNNAALKSYQEIISRIESAISWNKDIDMTAFNKLRASLGATPNLDLRPPPAPEEITEKDIELLNNYYKLINHESLKVKRRLETVENVYSSQATTAKNSSSSLTWICYKSIAEKVSIEQFSLFSPYYKNLTKMAERFVKRQGNPLPPADEIPHQRPRSNSI